MIPQVLCTGAFSKSDLFMHLFIYLTKIRSLVKTPPYTKARREAYFKLQCCLAVKILPGLLQVGMEGGRWGQKENGILLWRQLLNEENSREGKEGFKDPFPNDNFHRGPPSSSLCGCWNLKLAAAPAAYWNYRPVTFPHWIFLEITLYPHEYFFPCVLHMQQLSSQSTSIS